MFGLWEDLGPHPLRCLSYSVSDRGKALFQGYAKLMPLGQFFALSLESGYIGSTLQRNSFPLGYSTNVWLFQALEAVEWNRAK